MHSLHPSLPPSPSSILPRPSHLRAGEMVSAAFALKSMLLMALFSVDSFTWYTHRQIDRQAESERETHTQRQCKVR